MNYVQVTTRLRNVAQIVRRCPTATLRFAFVQAMQDFCNQTHWLHKDITSAAVFDSGAEGTYVVPLSGDDDRYLEVIAIKGNIVGIDTARRNAEFRIQPGDPTTWDLSADPSTPRWYAYKPHAHFDLFPAPDQDFSYRITAVLQPQDDTTFVPEDILKKHNGVIEAGTLAYLFSIPKQPWSDKAEAASQAKAFQAGINNAKADAQRNHNTGSQRVRPRRFIRG